MRGSMLNTPAGTPAAWKYLPGTERELDLLSNLHEVKLRALRGKEAGTGRLLQELPDFPQLG